jgi:hypothetical protein
MIATFARASFRAERNAARVRLPLWARNRARRKAQNRLMPSAPNPVSVSGNAAGGRGRLNFPHAVHAVAMPGATHLPARGRAAADARAKIETELSAAAEPAEKQWLRQRAALIRGLLAPRQSLA